MSRFFILVSSILLLFSTPTLSIGKDSPTILLLNSYHRGYAWSDQVVSSVESTILLRYPEADIRVEYMDTKRSSSPVYLDNLSAFYVEKFIDQRFDLIIASDDNAVQFLLKNGSSIFPDTPIVFCGVNTLDTSTILQNKNFTGVLEYANLNRTIEIATSLQPDVRSLVVVNDKTVTGMNIDRELKNILSLKKPDIHVRYLEDRPLDIIAEQLSRLEQDSIVLLLAYLRDNEGTFHDPHVTASTLSRNSPVPIYTIWDFYFNYGVTGGVMTSGYLQGETAAKIGIRILQGEDIEQIPVVTDGSNQLLYDHRQLQRFNLPIENLPHEAIVKNITYSEQKNVLLLHSYSADNKWSRAITDGIASQLAQSKAAVNMHTEYMDTKRFSDKPYLYSLTKLLEYKYAHRNMDLVMVADDNAFNFIRRVRDRFFNDVPVVFCGVNYLRNPKGIVTDNITGVIESYDILGTLKLGLDLFPETETIYIINDDTTTGRANRKRIEAITDQIPKHVRLLFSGSISMQQLRTKVASLDDKSLVLLMSFTMDKDNSRFSYEESVRLITSQSARPVLGFWDFFLNEGIIGGVITSGFDQGKTAGSLANAILTGKKTEHLPVVEKSPVIPTIDYNVAHRFGLKSSSLPDGVTVLNKPASLFDQYRHIIYTAFLIFMVLILLVLFQGVKIILQKKDQQALSKKAESDPLTGVKNRDFFSASIKKSISSALSEEQPLTLCYFDLDNLKGVNDSYGHGSGDEFILMAVNAIRKHIRADDVLCRMGGDEFVVILQNCTSEKALSLCSLAESDLILQKENRQLAWDIGISCGFSEFDPHHPVPVEKLIENADKDMYRNKMARKMGAVP